MKKSGSFKSMNLNEKLLNNIPFKYPTPIQRKAIPALLNSQNIIGIARTGSGKTLAYLIPAIEKFLQNKKVLILVPTRELIYQVVSFLRKLSKNLKIKISLLHGGKEEIVLNNPDIIIGTIGRVRHTKLPKIDFLVVDEVDKIFEDEDFLAIEESLDKFRLNAYFSATLPDSIIHLISEYTLIRIEEAINTNLEHQFFYVPYTQKESALLYFLSTISDKTIIFTRTKYSVEYLKELLKKYSPSTIYSSMDQENRLININRFIKGINNILIVTDLAARGLDIPHLNVAINYDLCDTKTFLHRIGRVGRQDFRGRQISLITFKDVYNYYKIKDKYLFSEKLGSIPSYILDNFCIGNDNLLDLKKSAENAERKANRFNKVEDFESMFRGELDNLEVHPIFSASTSNTGIGSTTNIGCIANNDSITNTGTTNSAGDDCLKKEEILLAIRNKLNPKKDDPVVIENVYRSSKFIKYKKDAFADENVLVDEFGKKKFKGSNIK